MEGLSFVFLHVNDYYLIESNPMTIIIGADCGNTLIIASDSKATSVEDGTKIINEPKIFYEEPIRGYIRYIIAGAGKPCYIEEAKNYIFNNCSRSVNDLEKFKRICEKSVNCVTKIYLDERLTEIGIKLNNDEKIEIYDKFEMSLIVGAAVNGRLGLFYVSRNGCARPIYTFAPIGTALGKSISRFLFKKIDKVEAFLGDNLDFNIAINSILYIIEEIKKIADFCGGETQLYILSSDKKYKDEHIKNIKDFFYNNIYSNINEGYKLKEKMQQEDIDYTKEDFIKDLKKVSKSVKKNDKQKPSSGKT